MKNLKKLGTLLLACALLCLSPPVVSAAENYIVLYGFAFDISSDNEAVIHGYDDRSAEVALPQSLMGADVTRIDDYAFFRDTTITSVSFEKATALKTIGVNAFHGCSGLTSLALPKGLEALSFGAFQNCASLRELTLSEGIGAIPAQCFYGCSSLNSVTIPESVTEIGERAFMNCAGLRVVEIPDTTERIAANAFDGCDEVVVYCRTGSLAHRYAVENTLSYVLTDAEPVTVTYRIGDADGDGNISILDVTVILRKLADLPVLSFSERAADVGADGLDITDATKIQRYLAELYDPYSIGEAVSYLVYEAEFV
ncbi:leucine-rich repeat protein [Ruminococcus sp.]|uniref:leucine-rich repeat protein n=1 Tax=Ruminococcus sp. TaxID=41978 RepID=UPI00388E8318